MGDQGPGADKQIWTLGGSPDFLIPIELGRTGAIFLVINTRCLILGASVPDMSQLCFVESTCDDSDMSADFRRYSATNGT